MRDDRITVFFFIHGFTNAAGRVVRKPESEEHEICKDLTLCLYILPRTMFTPIRHSLSTYKQAPPKQTATIY
jgi:hypothetical protein